MSIKKLDDGRYEVDVRPQGADGKRIRRKFLTTTTKSGWRSQPTAELLQSCQADGGYITENHMSVEILNGGV